MCPKQKLEKMSTEATNLKDVLFVVFFSSPVRLARPRQQKRSDRSGGDQIRLRVFQARTLVCRLTRHCLPILSLPPPHLSLYLDLCFTFPETEALLKTKLAVFTYIHHR